MHNYNNVYIDECIYCGGFGETNEHIIPFAMGGKTTLKKASCEVCRDITSKCEHHPLRELWAEARAVLDFPSRKRNFENETFTLPVTYNNGTKGNLKLPKNEALGLIPFPEYPLPAYFDSKNYKSGIEIIGLSLMSCRPNLDNLVDKYAIKNFNYSFRHIGHELELMIIKVAYCAAIAIFGPYSFEQRFIIPTLLRKTNDVGKWLGCDPEEKYTRSIGRQNTPNVIDIAVLKRDSKEYIVARVKFFAVFDTPEYIVVLGTLKPNTTLPPIFTSKG